MVGLATENMEYRLISFFITNIATFDFDHIVLKCHRSRVVRTLIRLVVPVQLLIDFLQPFD